MLADAPVAIDRGEVCGDLDPKPRGMCICGTMLLPGGLVLLLSSPSNLSTASSETSVGSGVTALRVLCCVLIPARWAERRLLMDSLSACKPCDDGTSATVERATVPPVPPVPPLRGAPPRVLAVCAFSSISAGKMLASPRAGPIQGRLSRRITAAQSQMEAIQGRVRLHMCAPRAFLRPS